MAPTPDERKVEAFAARIRAKYPEASADKVLAKARELALEDSQAAIPPQRPESARPEMEPAPASSMSPSMPPPVVSPRPKSNSDFRRGLKVGGAVGIAIGFVFALLLFADYDTLGTSGPSSEDFAFSTDAYNMRIRPVSNPDGNVGIFFVRYLGGTYELIIDFDTMEFSVLNDFSLVIQDERKARLILDANW